MKFLETIARIFYTTEFNDTTGRIYVQMFNASKENLDWIAVCANLLNYRLQNAPLTPHIRFQLISRAFEIMHNVSRNSDPRHLGIYSIMEQLIMRQTLVASPLDFVQNIFFLLTHRNSSF